MAMKPSREEQTINRRIARHLKEKRETKGVTQEHLGDLLGVSHQVIYRTEQGAGMIWASRLDRFARALDVPIGDFFDGATDGSSRPARPRLSMELMQIFEGIPDELKGDAVSMLRGWARNWQDPDRVKEILQRLNRQPGKS